MDPRNRQPYPFVVALVAAWLPVLLVCGSPAQTAAPPPAAAPGVAPHTSPTPGAPLAPPPPPTTAELMRQAVEKQRAATATQREAARKQAETAGVRLQGWTELTDPAPPPACEPMADDLVQPIIEAAAKTRDVQPDLLRAVIERESAFRPCAVSSKDARGMMQLMPATVEQFGVVDPFDPTENIAAGAKYLKQLLDKYKGDLKLTLAAYNAGPAAVDEISSVPPLAETQQYVEAILKKLGK
jgi:soluble lytic murein transglycosylase-like protein